WCCWCPKLCTLGYCCPTPNACSLTPKTWLHLLISNWPIQLSKIQPREEYFIFQQSNIFVVQQ
ncbi:hypothetical protein NDU88_007615, partial [Pleurodeles waltl]